MRSGEQRIAPLEKKSRSSTIQAQTNRSFVTLTAAAAARLNQPFIEQQVDVHAAGARGAVRGAAASGAAVRGALARSALARGGAVARGSGGASARWACADDDAEEDDTDENDVVAPRSDGASAHRAGEDEDEFADTGEDEDDDDDADDYDGVDDDPLVLEGEERNLTWLWDKVRASSTNGMTTSKCKDAVLTFHNTLSECIAEVEGASDNRRKLDLLLGYERDARACVSSLLSGKGGILLEGSHFSRVSDIPLPATVSGARIARRPERFRGPQDEHD